ncbi:MAG: hypothetical protein HN553_02295 [Opitutae bacterium]|nr:hypothetical protein [Opitutae bacterium]
MFIFRACTWLSLVGIVVYIVVSDLGPTSLKQNLENATREHDELVVQLDADKNESEKELSIVFRSRVDFRNKEEEQVSKIGNLELEIDGVTRKLADLKKKNKAKNEELIVTEEKVSTARVPLDEIAKQSLPLEEKKKLLEEEKIKVSQNLALVKSNADKVQSKFELLENTRNLSVDNFMEEQERMMEVIKKPFHIYYGDKRGVEVANRAPSGKGFFINEGYENGFRENMEFLTKNENASSILPFRLKATLVQQNFSFLEFVSEEQVSDPSYAVVGQLLTIERSGVYVAENKPVEVKPDEE